MTTLYHLPLDASSRFVRLVLAEFAEAVHLEQEKVWERRRAFLTLNPAATVPVLKTDDDLVVVGAGPITGYLTEAREDRGAPYMPADIAARAEVRRLMDWALVLMEHDVTGVLVHEKAQKRWHSSRSWRWATGYRRHAHCPRQSGLASGLSRSCAWQAAIGWPANV
jgi:glutathione S-transferase